MIDQTIPTGNKWKTASPINHKKLYVPAQNCEISAKLCVPLLKKLISPIIFLNHKINPPQINAGISGAKISPNAPIIFCNHV